MKSLIKKKKQSEIDSTYYTSKVREANTFFAAKNAKKSSYGP